MVDHPLVNRESPQYPPASRTGVILCSCGGKISERLDLEKLRDQTERIPDVVCCSTEPFPCSKDGQERLRQAIEENGLTQVVVAGCAPRLVEKLFRKAVEHKDGELCRVGISNIREGCTNVHSGDPYGSMSKAYDMIRMEIARLENTLPLRKHIQPIDRSTLVIGDSTSGLRLALALAREGVWVTLIRDKDASIEISSDDEIGGNPVQDELFRQVSSHINIRVINSARIGGISGGPGQYIIDLTTIGRKEEISAGTIVLAKRPERNQSYSALNTFANSFGIPQDQDGSLIEPRIHLRPNRFVDDGVFLVGDAHHVAGGNPEAFDSYLVAARILRFLNGKEIRLEGPYASVDESLCTGCANCMQVCPNHAVTMKKRDGLLSVAEIQRLLCLGCGSCSVACPVKAITIPGWEDNAVVAQIKSAWASGLVAGPEVNSLVEYPRILVLACEWSGYAAADMAGVRGFDYPASVRIVRLNCSAKFDPDYVLWALLNGADGVILGICPPGECHYGKSNLFARERFEMIREELIGHNINPKRLRLETFFGDDGVKFARCVSDFAMEMNKPARDVLQGAIRVR